MPSKIFQPLLYDTFTYKPTNTTYQDAYKWKKFRSNFKKRIPASVAAEKSRKNAFHSHSELNNGNTVNFDLNVREIPLRSKSAAPSRENINIEQLNDNNINTMATAINSNESNTYNEKVDQELANLAQRYIKTPIPDTNKRYTHWLQYPQEEIPKYIIDAKKRLNQIHPRTPPHVKQVVAVSLDDNTCHHDHRHEEESIKIPRPQHFLHYDSPDTPEHIREIRRRFRDERYKKSDAKNNKLLYSSMKPEELSKYVSENVKPAKDIPVPNLTSDSILKRSKTSLGFESKSVNNLNSESQKLEIPMPSTPPITIIYNHFQAPGQQPTLPPTPEYLAQLANSIVVNSNPTATTTTVNNNNNTSNETEKVVEDDLNDEFQNESQLLLNNAWDKYYGFDKNNTKRCESKLSIKSKTPTPTLNEQNDKLVRPVTVMSVMRRTPSANGHIVRRTPSATAFTNRPPVPITPVPENEQPVRKGSPASFDAWLQTANEKDKEVVLNMLKSMDGKITRPGSVNKESKVVISPTYGLRTRPPSSKRKLGQTRNYHKLPCEICERIFIKQHVWDLNRCSNCGNGPTRPQSASRALKVATEVEGYANTTSQFFNSMPTWRGQYIIHPDFTSENRDFKRIHALSHRPKSSKI